MNMKWICCGVLVAAVGLVAGSGCNWSSGDSLNTSQGAGITINFSGVYKGNYDDGKAVENKSGDSIVQFVINQSGNSIEVTDNLGNRYEGTVGSPGIVSEPNSDGSYPAGAELAQAQISFSGKDYSANVDIEFVGVVHAVAVTDVQGTSYEDTDVSTDESASSDSESQTSSQSITDDQTTTSTTVDNDGTNTTTTTVLTIGESSDAYYQESRTTVVVENSTGTEISRTTTVTGSATTDAASDSSSGSSDTSTTTTSTHSEYEITEANTQYRLEGTWIQTGGGSSGVDALSSGTYGLITTETSTTTTGTTTE